MSAIAPVSEVPQVAATAVVHPSASVPPAGAAPVAADAGSIAASAATALISPAHQDSAPLFQRIEEAVVLAIEAASVSTTPPGSTSSVAVNIAIQNAIESVLSGGTGLTPPGTVNPPQAAASETPSATTAPKANTLPAPALAATAPAATSTTSAPTAAPANAATAAPQNPLDGNAAAQAFFTLLEQKGVAPREFQQDFQIAFQHATAAGGAIVPSLATPGSLAGSFIDTTG